MGVITIGGPPGSGTTTIAKLLQKKLKWKYVYTGFLFREMARKYKMTLAEFGKYALAHPEIDSQLDQAQLALAKKRKNLILEGRISGWILWKNDVDAFKIYLDADFRTRAERVSKRENKGLANVKAEIRAREGSERKRYLKIYDFDIIDLSFYDIVIDTAPLDPDQICELILTKLRGSDRAR